MSILSSENALEKEKATLYRCSKNFPLLTEDLDNYFKPLQESDGMREHRLICEQSEKKQCDEETEAKASWLKFRNDLIVEPTQLYNPDKRFWFVDNLTHWLILLCQIHSSTT